MVDENSIPDPTTQSDPELISSSHATNNRNNTSISNNNSSISSNSNSNSNNNNHSTSQDQTPSTFLMYNRISNVIGDPKIVGTSNNQHSPNNSVLNDNASNGNAGKDKKKPDDHVWYEYGCV